MRFKDKNSGCRFLLNAPLCCFPSDNVLDSLGRRERISIKSQIKRDAQVLTLQWLAENGIKPKQLSKESVLINKADVVLTVYLRQGTTLDVHNLSIKHFLDQLVKMAIIYDDSVKYIPKAVAAFGGYVKSQSYAEFELQEIL